ncbi:MAG: aspartate carbamoyltransferase regulatory subunit [Candidatus Methanofastidiosia archaeon]
MRKELKVSAIRDGTVIDHITQGKSFEVAKILNLEKFQDTVTIAMNVSSEKSGKKDIVKIENRELSENEVNKISLVASNATLNVVRDFEVVEKKKVRVPEKIENLLECSNLFCVTRKEDVKTKFILESSKPLKLRCYFCDRIMMREEILERLR